MNAAVGQSRSMRVGKPEPCAPGKDFNDWNFMFNGYAGTLDPACPALSESSETITNSGNDDSTTRTAVYNLAVLFLDAHTEKSTESREESRKQPFRSLQTTVPDDQEGSTGLFVQIMTCKFRSKIEDVENHLNEFRTRYDEASCTNPVRDQVKKACQPETHTMKIRWKSKRKSGKGKKGSEQREESLSGKGHGETTAEHSRFEDECPNSETSRQKERLREVEIQRDRKQ